MKPTNNVYRAIIYQPGILYDIKSGQSALLPKEKMTMIVNEYYGRKTLQAKNSSHLPFLKTAARSKSTFIAKKKIKFPYVNRLRQVLK